MTIGPTTDLLQTTAVLVVSKWRPHMGKSSRRSLNAIV